MLLVLFGPPGCGKGTQATNLSKRLAIPAYSTGDMLRNEAATGTPKGQAINWLISNGYLVPDEMVNHMVFDILEEPQSTAGAILDGYPRTVQQAEALDRWLTKHGKHLDHVIEFAVNDDELVARRSGRLYAPISKRTYHPLFNPPKVAGKDDETGEDLIIRPDDQPEVVRHRLEAYNELTRPVLGYYRETGRVRTVDGMADIGTVFQQILAAVGV